MFFSFFGFFGTRTTGNRQRMDPAKTRRRIEDALRKKPDPKLLTKVANLVGVEIALMAKDVFLRFSHDKESGEVSFEEFLKTVRALHETVSGARSSVEVEVLTAEDLTTYNYTTVSYGSDEITEALKQRKRYSLDELSQEVWGRSFNIEVFWTDKQDPEPFMICVSCDKRAEAARIMFYGQVLDEETHDRVVAKFRRSSFLRGIRIGDGFGKPSAFNMAMGRRLTGIKLPIK